MEELRESQRSGRFTLRWGRYLGGKLWMLVQNLVDNVVSCDFVSRFCFDEVAVANGYSNEILRAIQLLAESQKSLTWMCVLMEVAVILNRASCALFSTCLGPCRLRRILDGLRGPPALQLEWWA
ncbi:hypothetical protein Nepgr_025968 [Nepenthes gracilis]|uniref:Uncharacterized protein n=1 Tax=Nepenthes gracilis TaxID=150966 RepID=A0AAD3T633_NEPGR|nr:hypothetical protein Nepgr_025968 [Nepenthes gracilis]